METWSVQLISLGAFVIGILAGANCVRLGWKLGRMSAGATAEDVLAPPSRSEARGYDEMDETIPGDVFDTAMEEPDETRIPTVRR